MKIDIKKAVFFVFAASAACLSAQELPEEAKEVTMCQPAERTPCPEDCRSGVYQKECQARVDDYDYDVYTSGGDREERCDRSSSSSCNRRTQERSSKSNCNNQCKRKSAASAARE